MTAISNLRCEYRENPLGIDVLQPRLSWQLVTDRQGARQTAYHILAATSPDKLTSDAADVWNSGKVESDQSVQVTYAGEALTSRQRVFWKVTVWDETGASSESDLAWFEMGLLNPGDWQAEWISANLVGSPHAAVPVPYFRKEFVTQGAIKSARLYVTSLGVFECSINGQLVGDDVLSPGWTDFCKRIRYSVYDVTNHLQSGENALGAMVGDGWAVGHVGMGARQAYSQKPCLLAQLEITLADGSKQIIVSNSSWKHQFGPIVESDIMHGESYDARLEMPGWDKTGFDDSIWLPVAVQPDNGAQRVAANGPTVKRIEELSPIEKPSTTFHITGPVHVFDLGQNMVGRVRFKGSAPAGTTVTLRYAEVLNADGSIYTTNLRGARVTDYYTFKGEGEEVWEPRFTFHGFRYVELRGYVGQVDINTITGVVLHSDMSATGDFSCSDELINQLQHNIQWGQKGNFLDVPTDCPQRDERLGWTGDIQVFVQTAAFNMHVAGFMTKWAKDVADAQNEQGMIPAVVPQAIGDLPDGGPAWADAAVVCPWTIYQSYGDKSILAENYDVMVGFIDYLVASSPNYIRCAPDFEGWPGFGDWLSINAATPRDLIGTAFFAYSARLLAQIADALGKEEDAARYDQLFKQVKQAFQARFLKGSSATKDQDEYSERRIMMDNANAISQGNRAVVEEEKVESDVFNTNLFNPTQTSYVLALHFDLLPGNMRSVAADELVADIRRRDMHLSTGFVGSPYLAHVLSSNGKLDVAYELLHQQTWPSWLYAVTQGATTIWERWDGWTPENGFQDPEMNSFNHYAYGAIGAWLYTVVAGLNVDPANPGYKHTIIRPQPGGGLVNASASIKTDYGLLSSSWTLKDGEFELTVVIPPNTSAAVQLPESVSGDVTLNGDPISGRSHEVAAGHYTFVVR